jgi:hypothetical protein
VTDHHGEKAKIDVTHREVGGVSYIPEKVEEVKTLPYHELRCILRIDKETGERILILGG